MDKSSAIPGFFKLTIADRHEKLKTNFNFTDEEISILKFSDKALDLKIADSVVENVIGIHQMPIGVATNFIIDGKDVLIPMANEEPSVIAGSSLSAKLCRSTGGFTTSVGNNICTGQVVLLPPSTDTEVLIKVKELELQIISIANSSMPSMINRGGGVIGVEYKLVDLELCNSLVIEIHINVIDAMGANVVTNACELVQLYVSQTLNYEPLMGILTNLSKKRIVYATAKWPINELSTNKYTGFQVAQRIVMAANLAKKDPFRAATHRKGIMNGISAVVLATGNDTRAVESAVHSYATTVSNNCALTSFRISKDGFLIGEISLPIPVGVVGGSMKRNKNTSLMRKLMKVESANDLARIIGAVGLAQNFAALKALVTSGISVGHMKLHSRNIAFEAGATESEIDILSSKLISEEIITVSKAKQFLQKMRCELT